MSEKRYTKDHEWVELNGNVATIGITHFAQAELGDLVFVDLPTAGKEVKKSDTLCVVESTKAASDVYAPVSGTVKEINIELSKSPELVNKDPYNNGWIAKLSNVSESDLSGLMSEPEYKKLIGEA
jgi:glycine cleavage system H protein